MSKKTDKILQSAVIANHFGFEITKPYKVTKEDIKTTKEAQKEVGYLDDNLFPMEEAITLLRNYKEDVAEGKIEPKLLYFEGSFDGSHKKRRKKPNEEMVSMHILNVPKSIADATLIKTAQVMLEESGIKNICVKINNIGGKDSQLEFLREATNYYRKNINEMSVNCRQYFKEGIYTLLRKGQNQCSIIHEDAPKPMDFLGDETRKHFKEIIEFLETMSIPYQIDDFTVGDQNFSSHTVFEIIDTDTKKVVAAGTRYNLLYKKVGTRKEIPAVGVFVNLPNQKTVTQRSLSKVENSNIFFMQIGYAAKLISLNIIDNLRKEGVGIKHKLYRDRLSSQIPASKKANAEYVLIIGQKEALEGTVIFRDKESKSQSVIDMNELPKVIKKIK